MSERIKGFTVTLEKDVKEEGAEIILQALSMIKGVADVEPIETTYEDHMNRERVKWELRDKFIKFIKQELQ